MNETLKLEHIAPYLAYDLMLQFLIRDEIVKTGVLTEIIYQKHENHPVKLSIGYDYSEHIWMFKPILRPLSDLTKMYNGDSCFISYMWYGIISTDSDYFDKDDFFDKCELGMINHLPYMVIPFLLENHFDVFGLISKGLAIDINTLKK